MNSKSVRFTVIASIVAAIAITAIFTRYQFFSHRYASGYFDRWTAEICLLTKDGIVCRGHQKRSAQQ